MTDAAFCAASIDLASVDALYAECDVLIVGGGGAGISAAIEAADAGASVAQRFTGCSIVAFGQSGIHSRVTQTMHADSRVGQSRTTGEQFRYQCRDSSQP